MKEQGALNQYKKQGFYLFESFFEKDVIDRVRNDAKSVFIRQMCHLGILTSDKVTEAQFEDAMRVYFQTDGQGFINCGKTCQHLISLHKLSLCDKLIRQIKFLGIEEPNICTRPVIYFNSRHLAKSEVYYKTPAHQDWRSMQGSLNSMVVWVPLVDINIELGALEIMPQSHLQGLLDSEQDEWYRKVVFKKEIEFIPVEVKAGDALFFSSFLLHQSGDNITDSIRWSCHFRYNDLSEATFIDRKYPNPYVYAPQQELVTQNFPKIEQLFEQFS